MSSSQWPRRRIVTTLLAVYFVAWILLANLGYNWTYRGSALDSFLWSIAAPSIMFALAIWLTWFVAYVVNERD